MTTCYGYPLFVIPSSDDRGCQSFFRCPASIEPVPYQQWVKMKLSCPLRSIHRSSLEGYHAILSRVIGLFASCGPATILRRVTQIVINPFKCESFSVRRAHIRKEVYKGAAPSVADGDPSGTVISVTGISGIRTPLIHLAPDIVDAGFTVSMSKMSGTPACFVEAPTTANAVLGPPQGVTNRDSCFAAVALTEPSTFTLSTARHLTQCHKATKSLASYVSRRLDMLSRASYNSIWHGLHSFIQDRVISDWRLHPLVALLILPSLRSQCKAYYSAAVANIESFKQEIAACAPGAKGTL